MSSAAPKPTDSQSETHHGPEPPHRRPAGAGDPALRLLARHRHQLGPQRRRLLHRGRGVPGRGPPATRAAPRSRRSTPGASPRGRASPCTR
ncbi:MAG: hypothetical protein WDN45_16065 [Caulobacteraceae bacterium]